MSMQTDVKAAHLEASGTLANFRTRLKGYQFLTGGTAGDIIFRDGGASGPITLQFNISAAPTNPLSVNIPGQGILHETSVHVTLPADAKITIFYG